MCKDSKMIKNKIEHGGVVSLILMAYDAVAVAVSYFAALWIRFDCRFNGIEKKYLQAYFSTILIYVSFSIAVFWLFRLYKSIWRFASYSELLRVILATVFTGTVYVTAMNGLVIRMPISYFVFGIFIQFGLTLGIRFSYRFILLLRGRKMSGTGNGKRVMLIGAGSAGQMILRDIKCAKETNEKVCCFIDDNENKWGRYIDNVQVFGGRDRIMEAIEKFNIEKIYVTLPSATPEEKRDILRICSETSCELMNLPGMYQFYTGEVAVSKMKPVRVEDLLGREQIKVNLKEIFSYLTGKTILVTGGGGSIGSELCRQIAGHEPARLIIFDVYENNAYDIEQELRKKYPRLDLVVLIGSVRDSRRINQVFETYRPDVVYHAAAHKHVPLMEYSPCESIKNNAIGTYKTAYAAMMNGCRRFVLISTDKAVNPTNIMGASKRLCEMIIQSFDRMIKEGKVEQLPRLYAHSNDEDGSMRTFESVPKDIKTDFVAVRFGNVLGSNGSVIPLFKKQIAEGGPVTVTHPDIIRYFMTISEAVSLVLQAGTYAMGGEIFVLNMGEPVKIDDLARNLINLSGYKPDVDIKIEYTGLRPGEKLYEEKLMAEEGIKTTPNHLIYIGCPIPFDTEKFLQQLEVLMVLAYENTSPENIQRVVMDMVTTYHPESEGSQDKLEELTPGGNAYEDSVSASQVPALQEA